MATAATQPATSPAMLNVRFIITWDITTSTASTTLPVTTAIVLEWSIEKLFMTATSIITAEKTMPITSISLSTIVLSIINTIFCTKSPSPNIEADNANSLQKDNVKYRYVPKNAGTIPAIPTVSPTTTGTAYEICSI